MAKTFRRKSRNFRKSRKRPIHKKRSRKHVMKKRKSTRRYNRRMKGGGGGTLLDYFIDTREKKKNAKAAAAAAAAPAATTPSLGPPGLPAGRITDAQLTTVPGDMPNATNSSLAQHGFPTGPITEEQRNAAKIKENKEQTVINQRPSYFAAYQRANIGYPTDYAGYGFFGNQNPFGYGQGQGSRL